MQDAKHSPALLGGATRMPAVQRMVTALFGRLPYRHPLMVGLVEVTCMAVVRQGQHAEQLVAIIDSPAAVEINRGRTRIESRLEITGARVDGHHGSRQGIQPMLLNFIHDQEVQESMRVAEANYVCGHRLQGICSRPPSDLSFLRAEKRPRDLVACVSQTLHL